MSVFDTGHKIVIDLRAGVDMTPVYANLDGLHTFTLRASSPLSITFDIRSLVNSGRPWDPLSPYVEVLWPL